MSMNPNMLDFQRQTDFIPVKKFNGLTGPPTIIVPGGNAPDTDTGIGLLADSNGTTLTKTSANEKVGIVGVQPPVSAGTGHPVMQEIGTIGLSGLVCGLNNRVYHFLQIPPKWDRNHPICVRVVWSSEAAAVGSKSLTWKIQYALSQIDVTAGFGTVAGLDTDIAADTPKGTAKTLQLTENGIINAGSLASAMTHIAFWVLLSVVTSFLDVKYLLGLEIEYTPRFGRGQNRYEAPIWEAA